MKKEDRIYFTYEQIIFLYVYLRQMDLSLDRARWTTWQDFIAYYQQQIPPGKVIDLIYPYVDNDLVEKTIYEPLPFPTKKQVFANRLYRIFIRKYYLTTEEIAYLYKLLCLFKTYLKIDFSEYTTVQEKLRICVARLCLHLEHRLHQRNVFGNAMRIEHYHQTFHDNTSMDVFSKGVIDSFK